MRERYASFAAQCASSPLEGTRAVFTGELEHWTRDEVESLVEKLGGRATGSVSRFTTFVVVGAAPGAKLVEALDKGRPVLTEVEFIRDVLERAYIEWKDSGT
ncbi:MAG: BRCT domain-containing protein [Dehalococcoidia bacterium]